MDLDQLRRSTTQDTINHIEIPQLVMLLVMNKNPIQMSNSKTSTILNPFRVDSVYQDQWISKVWELFLDLLVKFTRSVIHKNRLISRDHGCTRKTQVWAQSSKENQIKLSSKTMPYRYLLEMERELVSPSVTKSDSTDTREISPSSRTMLSLENEWFQHSTKKQTLKEMFWREFKYAI